MTVKNVEKLEKSRVAVTVEVGAEEFEAAVAKAYAKARGKLSIPGFRPGKAPRKMIEKLYGAGVFYSDAVDIALPEAYTQAIGQSGLDVVGLFFCNKNDIVLCFSESVLCVICKA